MHDKLPEPYILPHTSPEAELPRLEDDARDGESFVAGYTPVPIGNWVGRVIIKAPVQSTEAALEE